MYEEYSSIAAIVVPQLSGLVWTGMLMSLAIVITVPRPAGIRTLVASIILRFTLSVGLEPTLWLLGALNVSNTESLKLAVLILIQFVLCSSCILVCRENIFQVCL